MISMSGASKKQRVLITGASSGIGMASAIEFGRRGARIALLARGEVGLERAAAAVKEAGGDPLICRADVTDRAELEGAVAQAVAGFGGLDVVVVNAGAAAYGPFAETEAEDFDRTLAVTLRGAVDTIRLVLEHLERTDGALVVVGSVADTLPLPLMSAYTTAKHGLRGFVDALQIELRSQRSNRIPGAYRPEDVAVAIARCADRHQITGVTVGGAMVVAGLVHSLLNLLSERVLAGFARWARGAGSEGAGGRAIHEPAGVGELTTGLASRPSLVVRGVSAATSAAGVLTRR